ncbi:MAG: hypoxanthine phosphoribosyltransferase [Rikenellaceae bacterium]|nr:hypoxanthine phosphoribosyltransferase [Rikenellaceae bacterium]
MKTVTLHGRRFERSINHGEIVKAVEELAEKINVELAGLENPLFVGVLNGSFMFAAELLKNIEFPCEVTFMRMNSYTGTSSSGTVENIMGLKESIEGRNVIILEDIVESGRTLDAVSGRMKDHGASSVNFAAMFFKPSLYKGTANNFYRAMEIPNDFVVGFGLDYNGLGRNLKDVYSLKE